MTANIGNTAPIAIDATHPTRTNGQSFPFNFNNRHRDNRDTFEDAVTADSSPTSRTLSLFGAFERIDAWDALRLRNDFSRSGLVTSNTVPSVRIIDYYYYYY